MSGALRKSAYQMSKDPYMSADHIPAGGPTLAEELGRRADLVAAIILGRVER